MSIHFVEHDTITDKIALTEALQRAHWEESARNKHLMVLAPALELYARIEQSGTLFAVIAYDGDEIVGYSVNILTTNLHYSALTMANNDLIFVAKAYRTGRTGIRLIDETERVAAKRGARLMLWHAKENTPLAKVLPRMGCAVQDILFSKELPRQNFQLFGSFDVDAARDEALASDLWDVFTMRQDEPDSPHRDTRSIILREPDADHLTPLIVFHMIECRDTIAVHDLPAVRDLCAAACARLRVKELGRVMLVELKPGGHIPAHTDEGDYAEHYERFHLVLTSDEGNVFHNGADSLHMKPGQLWKFDHHQPHAVDNNSSTPRIHLIIDATRE